MSIVRLYATNNEEKKGNKDNIIQFPVQKMRAPRNQTMVAMESHEDVNKIVSYWLNKENWRNALLFVMGFNTGLRISDLIKVQLEDVFADGKIVNSFRVVEQKTSNVKSKPPVTAHVNQALREMLELYIERTEGLSLESYLFPNNSYCAANTGRTAGQKRGNHISRQTGWKIVKETTQILGIEGKYGANTLRKTPAYTILTSETLPESGIVKNAVGLQSVQAFLNHKSSASTLHYTGVLAKQHEAEIMRLNFGLEAIREFKNMEGSR